MRAEGERGFSANEFVGAREASRQFSALVQRLTVGEARRFVIVHRNRPRAVLLSLAEYERLLTAKEENGLAD